MIHIKLPKGTSRMTDVVSPYLAYMFDAEKSGDPFPVDFDSVWPFVYTSRTIARSSLVDSHEFCEGKDYRIHRAAPAANSSCDCGATEERITLSIQCLEFFIARKDRMVFEIYRQCRRLVTQTL